MILFSLFVVSRANAQTSDDNIQAISVKSDSTYYEPVYKDILNKMTDYSYYKNGKRQVIQLKCILQMTVWYVL